MLCCYTRTSALELQVIFFITQKCMPRLDALVGLVDASLTAATGLLTLDSPQKGFPTSRVPMGIFIGTIGTIGTTIKMGKCVGHARLLAQMRMIDIWKWKRRDLEQSFNFTVTAPNLKFHIPFIFLRTTPYNISCADVLCTV